MPRASNFTLCYVSPLHDNILIENAPGHMLLHELSQRIWRVRLEERQGLSNQRRAKVSRREFAEELWMLSSYARYECNENQNRCWNDPRQLPMPFFSLSICFVNTHTVKLMILDGYIDSNE